MSVYGSADEVDRLIDDVRATVGHVSDQDPPTTATGTGADGRIRVTAVTGGRIERFELDPRVMRLPSETLAEELLIAVNAALDSLRAETMAGAAGAADPAMLAARLAELQNTSVRQLHGFLGAIAEVQRRITPPPRSQHDK